jgi:hypothetical protein
MELFSMILSAIALGLWAGVGTYFYRTKTRFNHNQGVVMYVGLTLLMLLNFINEVVVYAN